jgi:adenylate cyclase
MLVALRLYNEACRKLLRDFHGYEAKIEGDASMLTFSDPISAVNYCVSVQSGMHKG